jgi:hypothetical protein
MQTRTRDSWSDTPSSYRTRTDYLLPVSRRTAKNSGHFHSPHLRRNYCRCCRKPSRELSTANRSASSHQHCQGCFQQRSPPRPRRQSRARLLASVVKSRLWPVNQLRKFEGNYSFNGGQRLYAWQRHLHESVRQNHPIACGNMPGVVSYCPEAFAARLSSWYRCTG